MSRMFGGRDPFDDPFFRRPLGSLFGSGMFGSGNTFGSPPTAKRSKGPVIEELDNDGDRGQEEEGEFIGGDKKKDRFSENAWVNNNPLVEHPEDQANEDGKGNNESKALSYRTDLSKSETTHPQARSTSFQRVTYGGINGAYYTATTSRRAGSDGVVFEESKQADKATGEAMHRVSRGIHDKGHSYTRKLNSDGKVDATQTLHNLHEDELDSFEKTWRGTADKHLAGWDSTFDLFQNIGIGGGGGGGGGSGWGGWALPFRDSFLGHGLDPDAQATSSQGKPKKVVRINIE